MARNVEIKARIDTIDALLPCAQALADGPARPIEQDDTFFHCTHGRLKLREFYDGSGELIHYQRDDGDGPKLSDYVRAPTGEPDALRDALTRALGIVGRVRKTRWLLMAGQTRIHLDRVEGLGDFIELEVVLRSEQSVADGEAIAEALMSQLQVPASQRLAGAYLDLLSAASSASGIAAARKS